MKTYLLIGVGLLALLGIGGSTVLLLKNSTGTLGAISSLKCTGSLVTCTKTGTEGTANVGTAMVYTAAPTSPSTTQDGPTSPAANSLTAWISKTGLPVFNIINPTGENMPLLPWGSSTWIAACTQPVPGSTTNGKSYTTDFLSTVSPNAPSGTASNIFATSSAGVNQSAYFKASQLFYYRGQNDGGVYQNGFLIYYKLELAPTAGNYAPTFIGLYGSTTAPGGSSVPSALHNIIYLGADDTQTTLHICSNNGSNAASCTDLGANFKLTAQQIELYLYAPMVTNGTDDLPVQYFIKVFDSYTVGLNTFNGFAFASGQLSVQLPALSQGLAPFAWISTGASNDQVGIYLVKACGAKFNQQ